MTDTKPTRDYKLEDFNPNVPGQCPARPISKGRPTQGANKLGVEGGKETQTKQTGSSWNDAFQYLPTRTQRNIRIFTVVGITSLFAFLVILFVSGISKSLKHKTGETIILQHQIENEYKISINSEDQDGYANQHQYELDDRNIKILKDMNGKAKQYEKDVITSSETPSYTESNPSEILGDWPEPTEEDIDETLRLVQETVDNDRKKISNKELRLWEPGTEPLRLLLISTWQSGSHLLRTLLQSHPGIFHHYEPLSYLGLRQVRSGKEAFQAQQVLHRLLDCNYDNIKNYMNYANQNILDTVGKNQEVWEACKRGPNRMSCADSTFLSESCKMFPIQFVKTSRLRLNLTQLLLNDRKLKVKVMYVARDPRAILSTRYANMGNCKSTSECGSPEILCSDMEGDLKVATAFEKLYPDRFLKVKYENFVNNLQTEASKIFSFLNLELTENVKMILNKNIFVDAVDELKFSGINGLWKKDLLPEEISTIERRCESVIKALKYKNRRS